MLPNDRNPVDPAAGSTTSLLEYAYLLWRWAWLIALAAVLAGGAAYYVSKRTIPVYQTTTRLLVSDPPTTSSSLDANGMITGTTKTQTYSQMLADTPVLDKVIKDLKLAMSSDDLASAITVAVVPNTQIISVTVSDTSPERAAAIANAIGTVFSDRIRQLQSDRYASTLDGLQKQVDDMSRQIDDTNAKLTQETDAAQKLQLDSRLTQYRQIYSNLVTSYEQVRLAEAQTSTSVAQAQPAQVPTVPVSPKTRQNILLAAVMAALLAAGVIFAVDAMDDTIRNPEEIRLKFGLPILGVIAQHESPEGSPITQSSPRSPVSESFRTLRTNVTYASVDTPLRRILITSPTPQDGKTTVCCNLAVAFAQGERKVVVVDADLRRPMEHTRFDLPNRSGLSELFVRPVGYLNGSAQVTSITGLTVITSGAIPPNPAELLGSKKMVQILDQLNAEDYLVLVDTPPVLSVTDAAALAPSMDGVIVVAKPGVTRLGAFKETLEQLQGVGAKILGVVLNEVQPNNRKYSYYYQRYYHKYSYYYSSDGSKKKKKKHAEPVEE